MAPSASLLVPFEPDASQKARPLQTDVQQIVKQKGAFRHVTEESLLTSIARPEQTSQDDQSIHSADTEPETIQGTRERLFATKAEVNRLLQSSMNETNTLLDLVSWVLSGRSKVAQTTMSPALKGGVPTGSAEIRTVPPPNYSAGARRRLEDTSNIVRLQAFQKCSDSLLAASERLQTEAQHQSRYWDQMASIRSRGWPISRLPRDSRSLVVHVASAEASTRHRNKGLLPLKRDESGDLTIPDMQASGRQQRIVIYVRRGDRLTGCFQAHRRHSEKQPSLEEALVQAKEVIFEEELFTEASREAQLMANLGARVRSTSIDIDITSECSISITYSLGSSREHIQSHVDDDIAEFVGTCLRTMLVAEHESRYRTRSTETPNPMTSNARPSPEYVLIRPIIAQIRHKVNASSVIESLTEYRRSLEQANLSMSISTSKTAEEDQARVTLQSLRQITASPLHIGLPSGKTVTLDIETQLAPPRFGTQFGSKGYESACGSRDLPPTTSAKAAALFLADVIARDVCCTILDLRHENAQWRVRALSPLELVLLEGAEPRAVLAVSCHSGSLAVSMRRVKDKVTEKVVFSKGSSVTVQRNGQREESNESLKDILEMWMARSL